jgi:hypothetical protein
MIRSRKAAITASVIGALLVAGAPTFAFGDGDGTHQAKGYSAGSASDQMTAQKAKDADDKSDEHKSSKADDKSTGKKKDDSDDRKGDSHKKSDDDRKSDDHRKSDDARKGDDKKKSDDEKKDSDRTRHDNDRKDEARKDDAKKGDDRSDDRKGDRHDGDWKDRRHDDKWDRDWNHDRDRDHRHHDWDTHRHYYRYGYYGPGWYDDCGYYGPSYRGDSDDWNYYGPDSCRYEYGGYRSHFLVDMSADQVRGGGARGAVGTGNLDIDVPAGVVCFRLAYDGIDRAIGAQIHPGRLGESGPNLVLLHVGENGDDGCVRADPRILSEIQNDPRGYYLEVDDQDGAAMRGQLDAPDYRNRY